MSLYDKYGGFPTVAAVVHQFYEKIQEESELDKYFEDIEMEKLINHQTQFLCKVLGGPDNYSGRSLAAAHSNLGITSDHFDLVGKLLQTTLEDNGVEDEDVTTIMGVVASVKGDIVSDKVA